MPYVKATTTQHLIRVDLADNSWRATKSEQHRGEYLAALALLEAEPDYARFGLPEDARSTSQKGLGRLVSSRSTGEYWLYDPIRDSIHLLDKESPPLTSWNSTLVRNGDWLVRRLAHGQGKVDSWFRYDPVNARILGPVQLDPDAFISQVLADDRVIAMWNGEVYLIDPESGTSHQILMEDGTHVAIAVPAHRDAAPSSEEPIVLCTTTPGGRVLARLDVANARLIRLASDPNVFRGYHGTLPDGSVIATLGGFHEFPRLVRISADGKASTTLFPK